MIDASEGGLPVCGMREVYLPRWISCKVIFIILHLPKNSVVLYFNSVQDIILMMEINGSL